MGPDTRRGARRLGLTLLLLNLAACSLLAPAPRPAPPPAPVALPAPAPAPPPIPVSDLASPADKAARLLLDYYDRLRQMSADDQAAEIARLDALVAVPNVAPAPDTLIALSLALAQQHNPGDLARAANLLEAITQGNAPQLQPWQPMARLVADQIGEQRRLEDLLDRQGAQRRDTQRTIQQLTEKLEALKAIERSMITRSAGAPAAGDPPAAAKSP